MKDKIDQLFQSAAGNRTPEIPENFALRVMREVRRQAEGGSVSSTDLINAWFPKVLLGAGLAIGLCLLAELGLSAWQSDSLSENIAQVSTQWLLP